MIRVTSTGCCFQRLGIAGHSYPWLLSSASIISSASGFCPLKPGLNVCSSRGLSAGQWSLRFDEKRFYSDHEYPYSNSIALAGKCNRHTVLFRLAMDQVIWRPGYRFIMIKHMSSRSCKHFTVIAVRAAVCTGSGILIKSLMFETA